ncbi:hypothetical protein KP509_35G015600 [Ceratopteris richardii]|nr:hypothetical protein KP509_35G015600 [Ceratopteris richardii]
MHVIATGLFARLRQWLQMSVRQVLQIQIQQFLGSLA